MFAAKLCAAHMDSQQHIKSNEKQKKSHEGFKNQEHESMLLNSNKTWFQLITGPSLVSDGNHIVTRQNHPVMGFVFAWFMLVLQW